MQAVAFYLVYPILYIIASLPFWALYKLSDFLYYLFLLSGYRRNVVLENLRNSFPEKSEKEIKALSKAYFSYLCDLTLETLKTMRMTEQEASERCFYHKAEWIDKLHDEKKSIIIVLGHYGNWEWAGPSFTLGSKYQLNVIYRPLSNPYFENMLTKARTKFGTRITPVNQTLREMVATRKDTTATAFIADQAALHANSYWTTFLHQDTSVFNGPEKIAVKFNYPVVYMNIRRVKRGFYELTPELLFTDPASTSDGEILETFTKRLEKDIINDPVIWLWSHRRWKHKRPQN
ncbi:MAG TPA: lysophospholipid acyltransferase family protein [Cyclobacteriaceae bacterium]|nr:lysophospholipid acyltransferase family protein [Cyclobacteriaceae bacterium]